MSERTLSHDAAHLFSRVVSDKIVFIYHLFIHFSDNLFQLLSGKVGDLRACMHSQQLAIAKKQEIGII